LSRITAFIRMGDRPGFARPKILSQLL